MAVFQAGAIPSSFGNVLFDPMKVDQAVQARQNNALMMDATRQQMGRQADIDSREHVAQAAGYLLTVPPEQRPTAYKAVLDWSRQNGHPLPNAPPEYPGDQFMKMLQSQAIPSQEQYRMGVNQEGLRAAWPGGSGPGAGAGTAAPAAAAAPTVPPELMPHFQEASARTGIPVATLVAQAQQESSMGKASPNIMQILDSTARNPGFGMTGVDPATLRDPRANINFAADYLKARSGGGDMADPAVRDAALKAYNGGGDPNYVQNVGRYLAPPGASGGVAGRTPGAVDVAGPGAGVAPPAATPPAATGPGPGEYTAAQRRQLDAMVANPGAYTGKDVMALREKFDDDNRQAAQHAFTQAHTAREEERQAARDLIEQDKAKREAAAAADPVQGKTHPEQIDRTLLTLGPKVADGTATPAERRQYALHAAEYEVGTQQMVPDNRPGALPGSTVLATIPRALPAVFPRPDGAPPQQEPGAPVIHPGTEKKPEMTADQAKVATFATRLKASDVLIGQTSAAGLSLTQRGLAALPGGNYLASSEAQQYQQAQRDFVNAVLRRESGAAISESEFESARKQYFPQPGDGPAVIAQKAANRATETAAFEREAGPAFRPVQVAPAQAAHPEPPPGFKVIR